MLHTELYRLCIHHEKSSRTIAVFFPKLVFDHSEADRLENLHGRGGAT